MTTFSKANTAGAAQFTQVCSDWSGLSGPSYIYNKPTNLSQFNDDLGISKIGFSGQYSDALDPPTNLSQFTDDLGISKAGFSGSYPDLINKPTIPPAQVQSNWTETNTSNADYILNKPTIPAAQIQSNWTETSTTAADYILNKPTIPAQVQSNWTETTTTAADFILNKPTLAAVATTGAYTSLTGAPVATIYNGTTPVIGAKVWYGSATTTSGVAVFYPTTTGTTSGNALFGTITGVQTCAVSATTNGANIPNTWIYSYGAAANAGIIVGCVTANGNAVANGTQIFCTVSGY